MDSSTIRKNSSQVGKNFMSKKKKKFLFSFLVLALPILQFLIFYIFINLNSIIMALRKYSFADGVVGYQIQFAGFENFKAAWDTLANNLWMVKNSFIVYALQLVIGISFAVLFSYYIYKKRMASGFYKVILFMPQILSSLVLALLFKYMVTNAFPQIVHDLTGKEILGLLDNTSTKFATILVYDIWVSFGVNVLLFSGAMSGINESIVEAAKLDGVSPMREFFSITLPMIWGTFTTFIIVGIAGFFTNQMHLYVVFGNNGNELSTIGYYMFISTLNSGLETVGDKYLNYPQLAALGLICTAFVLPITLIVRKLMQRFGSGV